MYKLEFGKRIITETYYEGAVTKTKEEFEQPVYTNKREALKTIIDALTVITEGQTSKLNIEVCVDNKGRYKVTKRWVV